MRRSVSLALFTALGLGFVADAHAQALTLRTPHAQRVSFAHGNGRAVVARKGAIFVRVNSGRIRIIDLPGGARPKRRCNRNGRRVNGAAVEFRGRNVSCSIQGRGPWQVVIRGRGISGSGVVKGSLTLDAYNTGRTGTFRIGRRPAKAWPRAARTYVLRT